MEKTLLTSGVSSAQRVSENNCVRLQGPRGNEGNHKRKMNLVFLRMVVVVVVVGGGEGGHDSFIKVRAKLSGLFLVRRPTFHTTYGMTTHGERGTH